MSKTIFQNPTTKMYRLLLLVSVVCCGVLTVTSQGVAITKPDQPGADSAQANRLNAASKQFWLKNLDSSVYYARRALTVSLTSNYKNGIAESYRNEGVANMFMGNSDSSKLYLDKALQLFNALRDTTGLAATYNNLGVLHSNRTEFGISILYLDSALTLFRKKGDLQGQGSVLNYIGINYQEQGNYQQAIDYCLQGFEIRKQINDHPGVVYSLINVGNMYLAVGQAQTALNFYNQSVDYAREHQMEPFGYSLGQLGKTYLKLKQYDKAETYLIRTVNGRKMPVSDHLATGELYLATGRLDSAIEEYTTSLAQARRGNRTNTTLSLIGLSKVYLKKREAGPAMNFAMEAYQLTDSLKNKLILADVATVLATLNEQAGNNQKAISFFKLAHSITDSVTSEDYQRKLAFAESKNQMEGQQTQVKLLSAEKELQLQKIKDEEFLKKLILLVFAIAILAAFLIIRNINSKRKKIESQKDLIESQRAGVEKAYSELKSTQSQLIQREKMASLGELTAGIAHEIQNPLNFVNNFSEVNTELLSEIKSEIALGNYQQVESLVNNITDNENKIHFHGKRADSIVKGMLQHSRSNTGVREPANINLLAEEYLRLAYQGMRAKNKSFNVILRTDFDSSIGIITIIPQEIGRVLLNLYNNAFFAVYERKVQANTAADKGYEPKVSVSTKLIKSGSAAGRAAVLLVVTDNGIGIPPQIVNKIFQPFFTTKPPGQGTGLGLSISYDIVKGHNGEIAVDIKEGQETTFTIELPIG